MKSSRKERIGPAIQPWEPHPFKKADYYAIKALYAGNASEPQQKRLWELLMSVTGVGDLEFRPGGDDGRRASDFAGGKRFVGQQLIKAIKLPAAVIDKFD